MSRSGMGRDVPSLMLSIQHFLCRPRRRPTIQSALKDGFGEVVVAYDMPEPCKFWSLDCCQKRFLWTHKEVDHAPHPVVGLVLQVGDTEKFPHALRLESLLPHFSKPRGSLEHHRLHSQFFFHFSLFSTALRDLENSRPVHFLMLFSHLFFCPPCLLSPFTVPCKMSFGQT